MVSSGSDHRVPIRGGDYGDASRLAEQSVGPAPEDDQVAAPGHDGDQAEQLLRKAQQQGTTILAIATAAAVRRLLEDPHQAHKATRLFNDHELALVASALEKTNASAELLGRAQIRKRVEIAAKHGEAWEMAEREDSWGCFKEDAEGHEHAKDGKFAPKGGGGEADEVDLKTPRATVEQIEKRSDDVRPRQILPVNGVRSSKHVDEIADSMREDGWQGPPLLVMKDEDGNWQAWTGSHRIVAAQKADLDAIPVVSITKSNAMEWAKEAGYELDEDTDFTHLDDEDRLKILSHGDDSVAKEIMRQELDKQADEKQAEDYTEEANARPTTPRPTDRGTPPDGVGGVARDRASHGELPKTVAHEAPGVHGVSRFDELDRHSSIHPLAPRQALEWFRARVPTLAVDAEEFTKEQREKAFTFAAAADEVILEKVKTVIDAALARGTVSQGPQLVQAVLDEAGVSPRNPQYAELVLRTNVMNAFNRGRQEEMLDPDVQSAFPVWQWKGISDGRERPSHRVHFDKYFPSGTKFEDVRDSVKKSYDGFNDRCTPVPVSKFRWKKLQADGATVTRFAEKFDDWITLEPSGTHVKVDDKGDVTGGPAKVKEWATKTKGKTETAPTKATPTPQPAKPKAPTTKAALDFSRQGGCR